MAYDREQGGILDYISSGFGRPKVAEDQYGFASNQPPPEEEAARREDSSSFGDEESRPSYNFKGDIAKLLAGALASYGVGKLAGDFDTTEALAAFGRGYLQKKDADMVRKMDEKHEQGKFMVQGALKDLDDLQAKWDPAKLQKAGIPQSILNRYAELQQKIAEARMSDGVVTPKEAQELIAFASPIRAALNEADTTMDSPEYKARMTEAGEYAGLRSAVDRLMSGGRSLTDTTSVTPEGEESDVYTDPEEASMALYDRLVQSRVPNKRGLLPKEQSTLDRYTMGQDRTDARAVQRHQNALELARMRYANRKDPAGVSRYSVVNTELAKINKAIMDGVLPEMTDEERNAEAERRADAVIASGATQRGTGVAGAPSPQSKPLPPREQRVVGEVYTLKNGKRGKWNGQALEQVP